MDPLSQTIAIVKPRALLWKQMRATGDWAIRFPANRGVVFCLVTSGRCLFQGAGLEARVLREGDFLLMTAPSEWTLGRDEASVPVDFSRSHAGAEGRTAVLGAAASGPVTRILGGRFVFEDRHASLVEGLLPAIAEVRALDEGAARLRRVLDLLGDEAAADRPGGSLVMERLLELMLIEVMRRGPVPAGAGRPNLLAGLADPRIAAALAAMHADIGRSWTVEQLAAVAGMSRSVFAQRFSRRLGLPPIDYLLRWRMAQAKDALRLGRASLAEVALGAGYSSVSAFSAAFSRTVGRPPSRYAAEAFQAEA